MAGVSDGSAAHRRMDEAPKAVPPGRLESTMSVRIPDAARLAAAIGTTQAPRRRPSRRIPPNLFGIPFGIAGLAEVWHAARPVLGTPQLVPNIMFAASSALWIVVASAYAAQGPRQIWSDLHDRVLAPFVSLAVITPMIPASALADHALTAAQVLVAVFLVLTVLLGGWLTGQWIVGDLDQDSAHPGYFLPTVAGGFVASFTASQVQLRGVAEAMFGIGMLCWVLLGSLILNRLFFRPSLPAPLIPTLAIEVAPPAIGGVAYFALDGAAPNAVAAALGGYAVLMVLVQLRFVPLYARLRFSPALWAFTFAYAAVATDALRWLALKNPPGTTAYAAVVLALITVLIGGIHIRSVLAFVRGTFLPPGAARDGMTGHQPISPSGS